MRNHIVVAAFLAISLTGCGKSPYIRSATPRVYAWLPAIQDVRQATLNVNGGSDSGAIQTQDPWSIDPTSINGKMVVLKVLGWLRRAQPLSESPLPVPLFGDHTLTLSLKDGKAVLVSQFYESDALGDYRLSQSDVAIGTRRYRDPVLARWLSSGWADDARSFDANWECTYKAPPEGHLNEISGDYANGNLWVVAADAARGCVAMYAKSGSEWRHFIVATHVLSGKGTYVEQSQFPDPSHGFVLVAGSPGDGMLPRTVMYATENGGASWHRLPSDPSAPFPQNDSLVHMSFTSSTDGWLVTLTESYSPSRVYVYHTTDGGQTWTDAYFPFPADVQASGYLLATAPVFQSALDGTIQVLSQWKGALFFTTTDGGKHWSFDPRVS